MHARIDRLDGLLAFWGSDSEPDSVISRLIEETNAYRETIVAQLEYEDIAKRLENLKVSLGEDLLMPALAETPEEPF